MDYFPIIYTIIVVLWFGITFEKSAETDNVFLCLSGVVWPLAGIFLLGHWLSTKVKND